MLRRVVIIGLVLALVGVVVPGFHHVRCEATISADQEEGGREFVLLCRQTFPQEIAAGAGIVGIVASLTVLAAGLRLAGRGDVTGPRALLALGAITLAVPALIILAGWGSAGFDLRFPEDDGSCHGTTPWARPPFWLQTTMCVNAYDLVRVPLLALAGTAAGLGALRPQRRVLLAGIAAGGLAVFTIALAVLLGATEIALVWSLPLPGTLLLAGGAWLARQPRAQPEVAAA